MYDIALSNGGAQVALSTSSDDSHPPENMIDGSDETFWSSTGLFPQEVVIRFQTLMSINNVHLTSYDVQNIVLELSENEHADSFELLADRELERTEHQLQQEDFSVGDKKAHCLRVLINSGYDHFVAIYKLTVNGKPLHG